MIASNLPALQVVVPLISAPICAMLGRGRTAWVLTVAVSWTALAIAIALLIRVETGGVIDYEMGGWAAPWGIAYRIDYLNAFVLVIVAGIGAMVAPAALQGIATEIAPERQPRFFAAMLLALTGLLGITITGDAFNLYVFLEIASLASYALVAQGPDRRALMAAFQYLILGTIGATFILIGVGLLYMMTGTLNMADLAARLPAVAETRTIYAAFAFIIVGTGLKLALFPLHMWLPNAYAYAPGVVSAFMAATGTKVGVYMLARFVYTVFGAPFAFDTMPLGQILMPFALLGIVVGSLVAIFQDDIKRMLAYSSVAQIGYMALGISFASETGLIATIVHLFNHALMKGALFLALAAVSLRLGKTDLTAMRGLGRRMPLTMAAFVAAGLSLIGVPLTAGFVSKWYLVKAAIEAGLWPVAVVILGASLLAMIYVWRVVEVAYFRAPAANAPAAVEAPTTMLIPILILAGGGIYFGIDTEVTVGIARAAAMALLGTSP